MMTLTPLPPAEHMLSTTHIINIPGTYHVVELMEQRLLEHMEAYHEVKAQIESAAFLFHHRWPREAFIKERLTGDRILWSAQAPPVFEGEGFGDSSSNLFLVHTTAAPHYSQLYPLLPEVPLGEANGHSVHMHRATSAFHGGLFWGIMHCIYTFSKLLENMNIFCKSCECHPRSRCEELGLEAVRHSCVMRGRRVPAICCGDLERYAMLACDLQQVELLAQINDLQEDVKQRTGGRE